MQRIDTTTASPTLASPAALGTPGYFSDGNPLTNTPPTTVPADWFNMIQEEIVAVILAASIGLDKADHTQLLAALAALAGMEIGSGYITWKAIGLTLNFGIASQTGSSGGTPVMFAKPFPNQFLTAWASNDAAGSPPTAWAATGNYSLTGLTIWQSSASGVAAIAGTSARWFALGH